MTGTYFFLPLLLIESWTGLTPDICRRTDGRGSWVSFPIDKDLYMYIQVWKAEWFVGGRLWFLSQGDWLKIIGLIWFLDRLQLLLPAAVSPAAAVPSADAADAAFLFAKHNNSWTASSVLIVTGRIIILSITKIMDYADAFFRHIHDFVM